MSQNPPVAPNHPPLLYFPVKHLQGVCCQGCDPTFLLTVSNVAVCWDLPQDLEDTSRFFLSCLIPCSFSNKTNSLIHFKPQMIALFPETTKDVIVHFPIHLLSCFFKFIPESPEILHARFSWPAAFILTLRALFLARH